MMETKVDKVWVQQIIRDLLSALGETPSREGLVDTPKRVAEYWAEFIDFDPGKVDTAFQSVKTGQLVAYTGIEVWSLCEHHLLPFKATVSIAYIPQDKVLGASKFVRVAQKHAHNLQIQERMVDQIAEEIKELTGSPDVAVVGSGVHLCMVMRGVKSHGAIMHTNSLHGSFMENDALRAELMGLVNNPNPLQL